MRHAGCSATFARAAVAPRGAVAQLEVVKRCYPSPVNEAHECYTATQARNSRCRRHCHSDRIRNLWRRSHCCSSLTREPNAPKGAWTSAPSSGTVRPYLVFAAGRFLGTVDSRSSQSLFRSRPSFPIPRVIPTVTRREEPFCLPRLRHASNGFWLPYRRSDASPLPTGCRSLSPDASSY